MKLSMIERNPYFVGLFVGKSSSGKTGAAASFVKEGPIELWSFDRRFRGILGCVPFLGEDILDKINVETFQEGDVFEQIIKKLELYQIKAKQGQLPFRTLLIEDLTTLSYVFLLNSMKLRGVYGGSISGGEFKGKLRGALAFPHPDDYNYVLTAFQTLFYKDLPALKCNVICSCWIVDIYDRDPKNEYGPPVRIGQELNMTKKLAERVPGFFDEVYLFEKQETGISSKPVKYTVRFESTLARTSYPQLQGKGAVDLTGKNFYDTWRKFLDG